METFFAETISIKLFSNTSTLILSGINFISSMVKGHIDVLMISESKLDNSFPDGQFLIEGYSAPF